MSNYINKPYLSVKDVCEFTGLTEKDLRYFSRYDEELCRGYRNLDIDSCFARNGYQCSMCPMMLSDADYISWLKGEYKFKTEEKTNE